MCSSYKPQNTIGTVKLGSEIIMFWRCFFFIWSRGALRKAEGTMGSDMYFKIVEKLGSNGKIIKIFNGWLF